MDASTIILHPADFDHDHPLAPDRIATVEQSLERLIHSQEHHEQRLDDTVERVSHLEALTDSLQRCVTNEKSSKHSVLPCCSNEGIPQKIAGLKQELVDTKDSVARLCDSRKEEISQLYNTQFLLGGVSIFSALVGLFCVSRLHGHK